MSTIPTVALLIISAVAGMVTTYGTIVYVRYLIWLWKDHKDQKAYRDVLEEEEQAFVAAGGIIVPPFATGGPLPPNCPTGRSPAFIAGWLISHPLPDTTKSEPLEETWSNEKVEAWRVISVTVKEGDDGLWLGFPHPDGPTEDVVTPIRHPVGVELHAECKTDLGAQNRLLPDCHTIPGEWCASGYGAGCGFYAYKTREQAIEHLKAELIFHVNSKHTIAKVLLSGKVIEHEDGYRAEVLKVISVESVSYHMSHHDSFSSVIEATTRAFNAFANIASGGV